jgi:hypothetical protein
MAHDFKHSDADAVTDVAVRLLARARDALAGLYPDIPGAPRTLGVTALGRWRSWARERRARATTLTDALVLDTVARFSEELVEGFAKAAYGLDYARGLVTLARALPWLSALAAGRTDTAADGEAWDESLAAELTSLTDPLTRRR